MKLRRDNPEVSLIAYLDDVFMVGTPGKLLQAAKQFEAGAASLGMRVHRGPEAGGKTELLPGAECSDLGGWRDPDTGEYFAPVVPMPRDVRKRWGMLVLGVPVGGAAALRTRAGTMRIFKTLVAKLRALLTGLVSLAESDEAEGLQGAMLLLRYSAAEMYGHVCRALPPDQSEWLMRVGDAMIWKCFLALTHIQVKRQHNPTGGGYKSEADLRSVAFSPLRNGGLGIRCQERHRTASYLASVLGVGRQHMNWRTESCQASWSSASLSEEEMAELRLRLAEEVTGPVPRVEASGTGDDEEWRDNPLWKAWKVLDGVMRGACDAARASVDELPGSKIIIEGDGLVSLPQLLLLGASADNPLRQSLFSRILDHCSWHVRVARTDVDGRLKAIWLSTSGPDAGLWLNAIPAWPGMRMSNSEFRYAAALRLGCPVMPDSQALPAKARLGPRGRRVAVDQSGLVALSWARGGAVIRRHDGIVQIIDDMFAKAGALRGVERTSRMAGSQQHRAGTGNRGRKSRYDNVFPMGLGTLGPGGTDVRVVAATGASFVQRAAVRWGAAAEEGAKEKTRDWGSVPALDRLRFWPLALEAHGTLGRELRELVHHAACAAAAERRCERSSEFARMTRMELSLKLQVGNARCIAAYFRCATGNWHLGGNAAVVRMQQHDRRGWPTSAPSPAAFLRRSW